MPSKNESIPSTIASQVAAEDTDYQSLMKDTDGQVLTPKSIDCSVGSHDMVTQSDNDGFAFKDTYISVNDAGSHCSKTETTDSSSVKDIAIQCFLVKTASPVVVGHNAKYDSIKSTVNASRVKDTVRLDSMKLSTEQVSVTDTVKSYSAKNVVNENAVEEKKPSLKLSFSLIHCPIQKCSEYNIAIPGKTFTTCFHNGVVCLQNGDLIFIDKANRIIKLLTADFQYKTHQVMQESPLDIALLGEDTVGVATSTAIIIYETSYSEIRCKNVFQTMDSLISLCTVGEDLALLETAALMTYPISYIQIKSKQDRIIKEIDNFTNSAGDEIYLDRPNLIRSRSDTELVVCEPDHMVVFGKSGKVKFDISTDFLRSIDNLMVDMHKNMYLCDTVSGIIYMISGDSTRISRILLSDIENPASMTFSPAANTLIIGCNCDNKAYVYRFGTLNDNSKTTATATNFPISVDHLHRNCSKTRLYGMAKKRQKISKDA